MRESGTRFIHVHPLPPGWDFPFSNSIKVSRLAVETGWVVLHEIDHGVRFTHRLAKLWSIVSISVPSFVIVG